MLYAIGDIHGMRDELAKLISRLSLQRGDRLIFIGDYVDRGPNPKGVVDDLIALQKQYECIFLMGNHEAMFLSFLGWRGH
jgi:serine/threonine protein phosphatase 1